MTTPRNRVLMDISAERDRQVERWGDQTHRFVPSDRSPEAWAWRASSLKALNDTLNEAGHDPTWSNIILEETAEAFGETDLALIREEAVQAAACWVAMIEDIDGRSET